MMNHHNSRRGWIKNHNLLKRLAFVGFWVVLFTLAYAQSPLFTSNQNQYFIHGLADGGYGYLDEDWLANTLDPTPVFSGLISLTYRLIPWMPIYYVQFTLLAGVYLFSLLSILAQTFNSKDSQQKRWLYLLALVLVHSAALRFLIGRVFDQDWAYLFDGGVAGQRLLGSVLQPSTFGVFLLLAIACYLRGFLTVSVLSLAVAATFHPTYLLSAGIITLIFMGLEFQKEKRLRRPLLIGTGALFCVIPILVTTFQTFGGTEPLLSARARELLVTFRIPHHAIPAVWFNGSVFVKSAFLLLALFLTKRTRLYHFILWPAVVTVLGTMTQIISGSDVLALLFPWRPSTWLVPLSSGVVLFWSLEQLGQQLKKKLPIKWVLPITIITTLTLSGAGLTKSILEYQERISGKDRLIMTHIHQEKQPGEVYLIPLDMQDFRLETGAPAYIEFKSIPYKDTDVLEWYRRVSLAGSLYRAPYKRSGCQIVDQLADEGVTHVILPYDHALQKCDNLKRGYWDWNFVLYEVRKGEELSEINEK